MGLAAVDVRRCTPPSGPDDVGDLPDGLHPDAAGHQRTGERFHALAFEGTGSLAV